MSPRRLSLSQGRCDTQVRSRRLKHDVPDLFGEVLVGRRSRPSGIERRQLRSVIGDENSQQARRLRGARILMRCLLPGGSKKLSPAM